MNIRHYDCVYVRKILRSYYDIRIIIDIIIITKKCSIIFYDYDDDRCVASGNQVSDRWIHGVYVMCIELRLLNTVLCRLVSGDLQL